MRFLHVLLNRGHCLLRGGTCLERVPAHAVWIYEHLTLGTAWIYFLTQHSPRGTSLHTPLKLKRGLASRRLHLSPVLSSLCFPESPH